jgi:hypothetical protein
MRSVLWDMGKVVGLHKGVEKGFEVSGRIEM